MFISLRELQLHPVRFKVEVPAGEIHYDSKVSQASVLRAEGVARLLNGTLGEIRLEGSLEVSVAGVCDRCLEPASYAVENRFDLVYMPASHAAAGGEDEIDEAAIEVGYYDGNGLELNDALREVVLLALPMQLTCREDCRGVCPKCGQNRNLSDCGCRVESADDRWEKLRSLRAEISPQ